jgi:hypothetical protein
MGQMSDDSREALVGALKSAVSLLHEIAAEVARRGRESAGAVGDLGAIEAACHMGWWSGVLTTIAVFMEQGSGKLSATEEKYLRSQLFGGMGSFEDVVVPDAVRESDRRRFEGRLDECREALWRAFGQAVSGKRET